MFISIISEYISVLFQPFLNILEPCLDLYLGILGNICAKLNKETQMKKNKCVL